MPQQDVTLAILAGGRGTRLGGVPKGRIRVEGRELIARLLDLAPHFADVLLVADDPAPYAQYPVRTMGDVSPGRGAPGGLHAALVGAGTPWVFLVACDMPFVAREVAELLLARRSTEHRWVCFERDGRLEPMPGLYHRDMAATLESRLPENPSFQRVLRAVPGASVSLAELESIDPDHRSLVSLNTPDDLSHFGAELPSESSKRGPLSP